MTEKKIVTAVVIAAISMTSVVFLSDQDLRTKQQLYRTQLKQQSRLSSLPDGGKGYIYPSILPDGGTQWTTTDSAPCVRRRSGSAVASCKRKSPDGGSFDFGQLNRFPVQQSVGSDCQPVACSVVFEQDAHQGQDARLDRERRNR